MSNKRMILSLLVFAVMICAGYTVPSQGQSVHRGQEEELSAAPVSLSLDALEAAELEAEGKLFPPLFERRGLRAADPNIDSDYIVFAYSQVNYDYIFHVRWESLTHIGSLFVDIETSGASASLSNTDITNYITNRSSYLKAGGAADAAGVKFIMVVRSFDDSANGIIEQVFDVTDPDSAARRTALVSDIISNLNADGYIHGVSLDIEFTWGSDVRDGIALFVDELNTALDAQTGKNYELSVYVHPTYSSTRWDISSMAADVDYILYSSYDYASGSTAHAIADYNNFILQIDNYLNAGLSPSQLVVTLPAYGRRWEGLTSYNQSGASSDVSIGFTDALYDVNINGYSSNYVSGDEVEWYTYNDGSSDWTATYDSVDTYITKLQLATSMDGGTYDGQQLGGVAFWSMYWLAELTSVNLNTAATQAVTRTYPHLYQLIQETLLPAGEEEIIITGYEGLDHRWRDPNESLDTSGDTDGNSSRDIVSSPAGAGAPLSTTNAMQVTFDFENTGSNQLFFRHQLLGDPSNPTVPDTNAMAAIFDESTELQAYIYTPASYAAYTVRMVIADNELELLTSDPFSLNSTGWQTITWDLTVDNINDFGVTGDVGYNDGGDGVLTSAGSGARDISFVGFLIEGTGATSGSSIIIDEVSYSEPPSTSAHDWMILDLD